MYRTRVNYESGILCMLGLVRGKMLWQWKK